MKSQALARQLEQERKEKDRILREQSAIKQENKRLTETLGEVKNQVSAEVAPWLAALNQINTATQPKPPDPMAEQRRQQAIANLEKAREAREAKKQAEEEKRKKMLKNLAKARKAKKK